MTLIDLANPTRFLTLTARLLPWLAALTAMLLLIGLYQSAMAPDDYQQGATVKIMFIHVPNAWLSMFVWGVMSLAALGTLVWRHPLADVAAKAAAPIGAAFTFLALVTGSLWGRPMWGTYWEWDARLTSVLILFLMYLGLIALWRAVEDPSRAARAAAILTLVGAINLPIIKFSVDWWNTLHQPASVIRIGGPTLDRAFLIPLLVMAVGVFTVVRHAASGGDAQRDPAPPGACVADDASQPASGVNAMSLGPYASFIVTSYLLVTVVVLILIAWIAIDYRRQKMRLSELDASGVVRRSGRSAVEVR
jgi:heme exporter protein C